MSRSALITGGGSGIGKAVASVLLEAGYAVSIAGRRADVLESTASVLQAAHPDGVVYTDVVDVGTTDGPGAAVRRHIEKAGGIDALVTAAAAYSPRHFCDLDAATWDEILNVALRGTVLAAVEASKHMREHGGGRIVLFSSINAPQSEPDSAHYSAAKAAVVSVAKSIAVDLAGTNVVANAIAPGWVYTDMTSEFVDQSTPEQLRRVNPLGRAGRVEEIASLVLYLVRDAPEFLSGSTIFIDGGQTAAAPLP
jgi:NAD(P)-dependent dehydrogenase (short-subunit alcohol dehydrogenase family)